MKMLALVAAAAALALLMGVAQAQSSAPAKAKTVKKAPVKKVTSTAKKPVPSRTAKAVESATPVQTPSQRLTDAERAIAGNVHTGRIQCELGANVTVTPDEKNPGFFHITTGKQSYYMHPVESRTGAIRMEDTRAGAMWLQLGNKSMLLNQKLGQRVADECAAPAQVEFAARMKTQPPTDLLGTVKN
ncbi:hypothetical protein [Ottowia sp.]|jgi:hypothetical protein|uniref:hypothetical protein n=1 Tax=Ottowia sp. TaxID=1898956 RepID=UPI0025FC459D|nr:hypothetical protein [Ottowia sp.]MBK6613427.1 hypothetical protein [Ottowia sp.]MBK6747466.1 hypothetical protein [Ottowia sp.]